MRDHSRVASMINDDEFHLIQRLIYKHSGIFIKDHKKAMVTNRLRKRLEFFGFSSYFGYYHFITRDPEGGRELAEFINCLTTNETFFFRHSEQFAFLADTLLPELVQRKDPGGDTIRIWCAACSSGEEPYSIAMLLDHNWRDRGKRAVEIVGTDINQSMIDLAEAGVYGARSVARLPETYRRKYFEEDAKGYSYRLSDSVKSMVKFQRHNLIDPFRHRPFDVIFCRNVLIYFNQESKTRVLGNLHRSLRGGGHLIIDYALSLFNNQPYFRYRMPTVYQKVS
jgi:chemotaxis protein methyltransferase CheR